MRGHHDHLRPLGLAERRDQLTQQLEAGPPGHAVVDHEHVEGTLLQQALRLGRAGRGGHLVAGLAQRPSQRLQDAGLVVGQQHASVSGCRHRLSAAAGTGGLAGSSISTRVPAPGRLSRRSAPPSASTVLRAIASPSPVPVRLVVKYGSKTCGRSVAAIPSPASSTQSRSRPESRRRLPDLDRGRLPGRRGALGARLEAVARVRDQVDERRPQPLAVGHQAGGSGAEGEARRDPRRSLERRLRRVAGDRRGIDARGLDPQRPREVEHVAHHAIEAGHLAVDVGRRLAHLLDRRRPRGAACAATP